MNTLIRADIRTVHHIAPLHYLPFIARSGALKSKLDLLAEGFVESHFRSKSKHIDERRGFGDYIHLSTEQYPPILRAKLASGFPHLCISIPATALSDADYDICRYNVAMSRQLRIGGKPGFPESPANGRYYDGKQIPIARTEQEQIEILAAHEGNMLEVLRRPPLRLPHDTSLVVFNPGDRDESQIILERLKISWMISLSNEPNYERRTDYAAACQEFIEVSLDDPQWRGNGLEFDKV